MASNGHTPKGAEKGPLTGYLILDLSVFQNGPFSTVVLSDMGADVIKVEQPGEGDPARNITLVPTTDGDDFQIYFETMNRNKRSITIDLKNPKGREVFYKLVERADVVVENFRVGVAERLGVDYEALKKVNPKIIRAANSGLGPLGPEATAPLLDIVGQARAGFVSTFADPDGTPSYIGNGNFGFGDQTGALVLAHAITLALLARERFGVGQNVETSQLGALMMLMQSGIHQAFIGNQSPRRIQRTEITNPLANFYKCGDGKWITLGGFQADRYWPDMAKILGIGELTADPRFNSIPARAKNQAELIGILEEAFLKRACADWITELRKLNMIVGPVQRLPELWTDPQCIANDYLVELEHPGRGTLKEVGVTIRMSATPGRPRKVAPEFGEHTEEILLELGYDWEQIEALRSAAAV